MAARSYKEWLEKPKARTMSRTPRAISLLDEQDLQSLLLTWKTNIHSLENNITLYNLYKNQYSPGTPSWHETAPTAPYYKKMIRILSRNFLFLKARIKAAEHCLNNNCIKQFQFVYKNMLKIEKQEK